MRNRFFLPAVSLAHLLLFLFARRGEGWTAWAKPFASSAAAVLLYILIRDLVTSRKRDRLPDVPAMLAWGGAALLEFGTMHPALSESRIVPAILFPSISFLLSGAPAAAYSAIAFAWLLFAPDGTSPPWAWSASIAVLGCVGILAGRLARRRNEGSFSSGEIMKEAIRESRLLVTPWENPEDPQGTATPAAMERMGLLRLREEAMDGVRRILEGVLPVTGAERILYVFPAPGSGAFFRVGASAIGGHGRTEYDDLTFPQDYLPIREAMLFHRTFSAEGDAARNWSFPDGGSAIPTGVVSTPVCIEGKAVGAILAARFAEGKWKEPSGQLLEMAAFLAARELLRAQKQYRMDRYLAGQEGFHRLVRKIAEISETREGENIQIPSPRSEVYKVTVEQARRRLDIRRVLFVESSPDGRKGRIGWESREGFEGENDEWISMEGTYAEWVVKQGVHRIFSGEHASGGRYPILPQEWRREPVNACLLLPVADRGGIQGVLVCEGGEGRLFEGEDVEASRDMLAIMRMGISHALRLESLEREAKNDGLTGLLNRKTFEERLTNVVSRLDGRYFCAVIMLDIDHFKRINDTYGHSAGDDVIRKVSAVIRKTVRKVDMAGRYGGEEFAIYLHGTDQDKAFKIAERLRLIIRQTRFVFQNREVSVTVSLGIACHPAHGVSGTELLKRADESLYRSKEGGRDRTTLFIKR